MKTTTFNIIEIAVWFAAGCLLGAGLYKWGVKVNLGDEEPKTIHDTVTIQDTVRIMEKTAVRSVTLYDTTVVFFRDTVRDTIRVQIPIEEKVYQDTIETDSATVRLGVYYHGYRAGIDRVDVQTDVRPATNTIVKKRGWGQFIGVGVGVGYGASVVGGRVVVGPEIGLHVTYGLGYRW